MDAFVLINCISNTFTGVVYKRVIRCSDVISVVGLIDNSLITMKDGSEFRVSETCEEMTKLLNSQSIEHMDKSKQSLEVLTSARLKSKQSFKVLTSVRLNDSHVDVKIRDLDNEQSMNAFIYKRGKALSRYETL